MRKRVNLSGIVLAFGIFMGVATAVSAGMPTVTLSPKVVKVGDEMTVTISPNGWTLKTGPTLAGPATGELSASGGTLNATGPGYITVDTTWERPDGQGGEETASVTGTATVVYVALDPVAMGNKPDLEPGRMCLNAQPEYKKAKWKATVLPEGTTAKIGRLKNVQLSVALGDISNGDIIIVEGTAHGTYQIDIYHTLLDSCEATGKEKCFIIFGRDLGNTGYPKSASNTVSVNWDGFSQHIQVRQVGPGSSSQNIRARKTLDIFTQPEGLYSGNVGIDAKINALGATEKPYDLTAIAMRPFIDKAIAGVSGGKVMLHNQLIGTIADHNIEAPHPLSSIYFPFYTGTWGGQVDVKDSFTFPIGEVFADTLANFYCTNVGGQTTVASAAQGFVSVPTVTPLGEWRIVR